MTHHRSAVAVILLAGLVLAGCSLRLDAEPREPYVGQTVTLRSDAGYVITEGEWVAIREGGTELVVCEPNEPFCSVDVTSTEPITRRFEVVLYSKDGAVEETTDRVVKWRPLTAALTVSAESTLVGSVVVVSGATADGTYIQDGYGISVYEDGSLLRQCLGYYVNGSECVVRVRHDEPGVHRYHAVIGPVPGTETGYSPTVTVAWTPAPTTTTSTTTTTSPPAPVGEPGHG